MGAHALLRACPVRRQDFAPIHVRIAQKAVGRDGFAPAIARRRDGFGIRSKSQFAKLLKKLANGQGINLYLRI